MKLDEFEDYCNKNLDDRKLEISVLKQILNKTSNTEKEINILSKSFIVFIYSNWQGCIDEISKKYLEFVNFHCSKGICKLNTDFYTSNLKIKVLQEYFGKLYISYDDFILKCSKELRFNKNEITKINGSKSIDLGKKDIFHDNLCYIINVVLVENRNSIVHGKSKILPGIVELNILSDFLLKILEKYKEILYVNLENETYLLK